MAEAIIVDIAGEIIAKLVPQALERVGKLWGVKHELELLRDIVSTLRAIRQIHVWLEKLKNAFYDAQDVVEEINIEAMRGELRGHNEMVKEVRTFFSSSNQFAFKLKISYNVEAVREKIKAINASRSFHLAEQSEKREETHSFIREADILGRDDDKKIVMEFILDSNMKEHVSILPIFGIGGLGKTALAQFIYNDEMISKNFNLKMWVCVSNDFDVKKIVKNIIACAKKKETKDFSMEQL
ncbi:hypothetical protein ACJRO7_010332 [Eucalyptus globulus]|uniref:Uncharacterized protein n=1 Tax=Eucalyptus globulus TaxID=34317 RepID=A0ABD3LCT3_EUCGL